MMSRPGNSSYRWSLRKGGRKERCPQCGKMRFVPFVLTDDPRVKAGPEYGRCDREQSCGYFRYPGREVKWTSDRELPREVVMDLPMLELPAQLAELDAPTDANSLLNAYAPLLGRDNLRQVMAEYRCGTAGNACVFWQYDGECVRTGKAIRYGRDGHRLKDENGTLPVYWAHKAHPWRERAEGHRVKQCLFGQHLLSKRPDDRVMVVEGEKTAVLMAALDRMDGKPGNLWIACGGSQMLKGAIDLMPLAGRRVTLVPDDGQYWNWVRVANTYGWNCLDIEPKKEALGLPDGCDIWDIAEAELKGGTHE